MAHEAIKEATEKEILSSRALSYRKSTLTLGLIVVAVHYLYQIDYSNLNLLGVRLTGEGQELRARVLFALWLLFIYHGSMLAYYGCRDFRVWVSPLISRPHGVQGQPYFPELGMYLWRPPRRLSTKSLAFNDGSVAEGWGSQPFNEDLQWCPDTTGMDPDERVS